MPDSIHYVCRNCGQEHDVEGPPVKTRTCPMCGGESRPERGRSCAECGGTIVSKDCTLTETDGSQLRECADCGAHGVRYFQFGAEPEEDVVAGPVYGRAS